MSIYSFVLRSLPQLRRGICMNSTRVARSSHCNRYISSFGIQQTKLSIMNCGAHQPQSLHIRSISSSPSKLPDSLSNEHLTDISSLSLEGAKSREPTSEMLDNIEDDDELTQEEIWNAQPAVQRSFNFAPYANDSQVIKELVKLGVEVYRWEKKFGIPEFILKLDFHKDVAPYIMFLCDHGIHPDELGNFFTKNPFVLKESLDNLERRIKYLESKKFSEDAIATILRSNPYWIVFSTKRIDKRLGFFQDYFSLTGAEVRQLAIVDSKLITDKLNLVKEITFTLKERCGFEPDELKELLLKAPVLFRKYTQDEIWRRFDLVHNEMKFSHERILKWPQLLLTKRARVKARIGFLQKVGRAQFNPDKPNFVPFVDILDKDDVKFATKVALSSVRKYNEYLKSV